MIQDASEIWFTKYCLLKINEQSEMSNVSYLSVMGGQQKSQRAVVHNSRTNSLENTNIALT